MDPQLYLEFDSNLNAARAEEGIGRCAAAAQVARLNAALVLLEQEPIWPLGLYPMPPEEYNNAPYPDFANGYPPAAAFTWFYDRCKPKAGEGAGGVFVLDDAVVAFLTSQTLSDGSTWSVDLQAEAKTAEQLSAAGQAAIAPPVWPPE